MPFTLSEGSTGWLPHWSLVGGAGWGGGGRDGDEKHVHHLSLFLKGCSNENFFGCLTIPFLRAPTHSDATNWLGNLQVNRVMTYFPKKLKKPMKRRFLGPGVKHGRCSIFFFLSLMITLCWCYSYRSTSTSESIKSTLMFDSSVLEQKKPWKSFW